MDKQRIPGELYVKAATGRKLARKFNELSM